MQISVWIEMHKYGEASPDYEVVGAMLGQHVDDKNFMCDEFIPLTNVAEQNVDRHLVGGKHLAPESRYVPEPNEMFQALRKTTLMNKDAKKDFIGIFHTHPHHASYASMTDIYGAGYAGFYPIFSLQDKQTNVFFYDGINRGFDKAELTLIGD